ncbi:MAG: hypothetical protein JRH20_23605, partial [Deltaproteobacteria bacterium]|nr:hypothetical protein [Deltaproteobacteria bacterium]
MEVITRDIRGVTASSQSDVKHILTDIKQITAQVRSILGDSKAEDGIKQGVKKLTSAVDKLDKAMNTVGDITKDVHSVTSDLNAGKGTVGRLLKDEALIDDVEEVVRETGGLIKSLTSLQTIVGLRSEYNFQAGTIKTYLSIELRPRPDKYYLIELIDDPRGRREMTTE